MERAVNGTNGEGRSCSDVDMMERVTKSDSGVFPLLVVVKRRGLIALESYGMGSFGLSPSYDGDHNYDENNPVDNDFPCD